MSLKLTKMDLVEVLHEEIGFNKREAKDLVDLLLEEMRKSLEKGESVKLPSFGNFDLRDKSSRPGRNPRTGVEAAVSARRVVIFHPSRQLKKQVFSYGGS